eukprot:GABU01009392.1.p3 GENE.GABU01009392.1~~GABU01009392.1.p3  ORF type:complete len:161 (-),score=32.02 GABU01009392.1:915-1331(-)
MTTLLDFVEAGADERSYKDPRISQKPKQTSGFRSPNQPQIGPGKKKASGIPLPGSQVFAQQTKDLLANSALADPSNFPKISEVMDQEKPSESNKTAEPVKKNKPQKAGKKQNPQSVAPLLVWGSSLPVANAPVRRNLR